jgi:hypothetical protein
MIDLHDFKKFGELWWGKIVYNGCPFTWVKFHGNFFIKIGTSQLIIIITMIFKGLYIYITIKSLICVINSTTQWRVRI